MVDFVISCVTHFISSTHVAFIKYQSVQCENKERPISLTFESFIKPTSVTLPESSLGQSVSDSGH